MSSDKLDSALKYVITEPERVYKFGASRIEQGKVVEDKTLTLYGDELDPGQLELILVTIKENAKIQNIDLGTLDYDELSENIDSILKELYDTDSGV